jgi:hypothetical protein
MPVISEIKFSLKLSEIKLWLRAELLGTLLQRVIKLLLSLLVIKLFFRHVYVQDALSFSHLHILKRGFISEINFGIEIVIERAPF